MSREGLFVGVGARGRCMYAWMVFITVRYSIVLDSSKTYEMHQNIQTKLDSGTTHSVVFVRTNIHLLRDTLCRTPHKIPVHAYTE